MSKTETNTSSKEKGPRGNTANTGNRKAFQIKYEIPEGKKKRYGKGKAEDQKWPLEIKNIASKIKYPDTKVWWFSQVSTVLLPLPLRVGWIQRLSSNRENKVEMIVPRLGHKKAPWLPSSFLSPLLPLSLITSSAREKLTATWSSPAAYGEAHVMRNCGVLSTAREKPKPAAMRRLQPCWHPVCNHMKNPGPEPPS